MSAYAPVGSYVTGIYFRVRRGVEKYIIAGRNVGAPSRKGRDLSSGRYKRFQGVGAAAPRSCPTLFHSRIKYLQLHCRIYTGLDVDPANVVRIHIGIYECIVAKAPRSFRYYVRSVAGRGR